MWAESTPGQGSSFYFTLPFVPPMLVAAVTSTSREIHRREVGGLAVVERSPVLSRILERRLDGIKVAHYDSTEELVRLVEQSASACPEAVLINEPLNMEPLPAQWPEVLRHAPILRYYMPSMVEQGVQGVGEHPDHEAVMVDHYLSKPFTREQLNGAIDQLLVSSRKRDPETPIDGQTGSAFPARILVIEDDDDTSFLIDRMLRAEATPDRRSVTTIEARNGAQAIEIMLSIVAVEGPDIKSSKDTIDGVLLDIQLGDMTGFDVLSEMSRHEGLRRIPVCLMSGYAPYTGDGPLITPYLTLTRYDGIAAKDAVEAIVHLLHVALPGINATLSPNAVSQ